MTKNSTYLVQFSPLKLLRLNNSGNISLYIIRIWFEFNTKLEKYLQKKLKMADPSDNLNLDLILESLPLEISETAAAALENLKQSKNTTRAYCNIK